MAQLVSLLVISIVSGVAVGRTYGAIWGTVAGVATFIVAWRLLVKYNLRGRCTHCEGRTVTDKVCCFEILECSKEGRAQIERLSRYGGMTYTCEMCEGKGTREAQDAWKTEDAEA